MPALQRQHAQTEPCSSALPMYSPCRVVDPDRRACNVSLVVGGLAALHTGINGVALPVDLATATGTCPTAQQRLLQRSRPPVVRQLGRAARAGLATRSGDHHSADYSSDGAANGAPRGRKSREIGERSNGRSGNRDAEHHERKPDHGIPLYLNEYQIAFALVYEARAGLQRIESARISPAGKFLGSSAANWRE